MANVLLKDVPPEVTLTEGDYAFLETVREFGGYRSSEFKGTPSDHIATLMQGIICRSRCRCGGASTTP